MEKTLKEHKIVRAYKFNGENIKGAYYKDVTVSSSDNKVFQGSDK
jgi:hypothetical protein